MRIAALLVAPLLLVAPVALADDAPSAATSPAPKNATAPAPSSVVKSVPKAPELEPKDPATSPGVAGATADLKRIRERANQVDPKEQEVTEKSLRETAAGIDAATAKKEKVEVAGRLAAEFGGIPELYIGEHDRLKQSWGEISIAHTLLADAKTSLTIDQLFDLRQEKLGWGQIAHGLDLSPSEFSKSAQARANSASSAGAAGKGETVEAKADAAPPSAAAPGSASTKAKSKK
jgi:hypothetical protein